MVKKPNGVAKAKGAPASAGDSAVAEPSKVNASSPGSVKTSKFKKRKVVRVKRVKIATAAAAADEVASVGVDTKTVTAAAAAGEVASVGVDTKTVTAAAASGEVASVGVDTKTVTAAAAADEVASVGAGTAGADAPASVSMPQPAAIAEASPMAQAPKPTTDAEGSVPAPMPDNAEASASAAKQNAANTDADAAAAASKGKDVSANNSGGDRKMKKSRKERAKQRAMNDKGKEMEDYGGRNGKGYKAVAKKEGRGEDKAAGFIFMCNQQTKQECYQNRLFGLPSGKIGMVKKIRPGAKLFLYDFDLKLLYGVYKAASNGGLNLVREAFHGKFPAQVKFKIFRDCLPLRESNFKHAIKENYKAKSKFDPELNSKQVQRLIALFKPAKVPQSVPNKRLDERRHHGERRQPYHYEQRRPIEEVRQPRFDEHRHPAVIHVPVEDPYRAPRFAPLPVESRLGRSLVNVQEEHMYYEPMHPAPEPRHIPLAMDSRNVPMVLERQHAISVPEPRHVPSAYYRTLAPSDDSYYQSVADLGPERFTDRTVAERTARDPIITRDHTTLPVDLSARTERMDELYRTGGPRGAHVEELYRPREIAVRADRMGISTRADHLEDLYRYEQLDARAVDPPRRSTYMTSAYGTHPAYAEPSQRPYSARAKASGGPVSSLYSFSDGPAYR